MKTTMSDQEKLEGIAAWRDAVSGLPDGTTMHKSNEPEIGNPDYGHPILESIDFEKEMCMSLQDEINKTLQDKERSDRIAKYVKEQYGHGWKRI